MLRSARFWLAVILVCILACFLIRRAMRFHQSAPAPAVTADYSANTDMPQTEKPVTFFTERTTVQTTSASSAAASTHTETVTAETDPTPEPAPRADESYLTRSKISELLEHAETLADLADYTGWLYVPDSAMDYPVMQGTDNFYYLSHSPDGQESQIGSIMLDYRNQRSYADPVHILYGHNLSYGMFGDLRSFKEQAEFDSHKYGWLATPDTLFRIDFFALAVVSGYDSLYDIPCTQEDWLAKIRKSAMYDAVPEIVPEDSLIALSTCTVGEPEQARALFVGRLVPMQQPEDALHP